MKRGIIQLLSSLPARENIATGVEYKLNDFPFLDVGMTNIALCSPAFVDDLIFVKLCLPS